MVDAWVIYIYTVKDPGQRAEFPGRTTTCLQLKLNHSLPAMLGLMAKIGFALRRRNCIGQTIIYSHSINNDN